MSQGFFQSKLGKAALLSLLNILVVWAGILLINNQSYWLCALLGGGAFITNLVFLLPGAYHLRYLLPATFFTVLLVVYPIGYTVIVAFTNYGTGNLLTMNQVINQFENKFFLDRNAENYSFQVFQDSKGDFAFVFSSPQGNRLLGMNGSLEQVTETDPRLVDSDGDGVVEQVLDYHLLERRDILRYTNELSQISFDYDETHQLRMRNATSFALYTQQYVYERSTQELINLQTGEIYKPVDGAFQSAKGERLTPGFRTTVGWRNFQRLFTNPQISNPFVGVFIWTVQWAFLSVVTTFALGLFIALLLNDPYLRFKKFYRAILVLPYAIPAFISALIWRGLYHTELGIINRVLVDLFGLQIPWLQDPFWAKVALVILNLWLGFPYMMIICLGALQSIPGEMYEAAHVDGATAWQQFRHITMPLLLVSVTPLLISSFSFNFNNFNVIYLLTRGRPPIPGAQTPAGSTDILISYTYRLAFESGRGVDYGLASAVTIIIFLLVGTISYFNFRFTGALEDVNRNV